MVLLLLHSFIHSFTRSFSSCWVPAARPCPRPWRRITEQNRQSPAPWNFCSGEGLPPRHIEDHLCLMEMRARGRSTTGKGQGCRPLAHGALRSDLEFWGLRAGESEGNSDKSHPAICPAPSGRMGQRGRQPPSLLPVDMEMGNEGFSWSTSCSEARGPGLWSQPFFSGLSDLNYIVFPP